MALHEPRPYVTELVREETMSEKTLKSRAVAFSSAVVFVIKVNRTNVLKLSS